MIDVGSRVRILEDEYPELVGAVGEVTNLSRDKTCAWVESDHGIGVWCAIAQLEDLIPEEES